METKNRTASLLRALVLAAALALALALSACSQQVQQDGSKIAESRQNPAQSQQVEPVERELDGKPWVTSVFVGNIPDEAPAAADDLYLHYTYDYIADHQSDLEAANAQLSAEGEVREAVVASIKDEQLNSPELEQLRIFFDQASDLDALKEIGAKEVMPYLDAVQGTQSLDELEEVLLSDDFPFSPWLDTIPMAPDMKSVRGVYVTPHMLFTDETSDGNEYQDSDDEKKAKGYKLLAELTVFVINPELALLDSLGTAQSETDGHELFELEKSYGKDIGSSTQHSDEEYGATAASIVVKTLDEFQAACPNFPVRETMAKLGLDGSESYIIENPEWLESFNAVWSEDNFELLRTMTAAKVLHECLPYIDPSLLDDEDMLSAEPPQTAEEFAYKACNNRRSFAQLLAKTYVEQTLGESAVNTLEKLTNELIDSYIDLVEATPWLNEETRESIADKIDNMALNILYPESGYFDYSGLELVPTDQGGTLLSNYLRVKAYNSALEAQLVGQPANADALWLYIAPTFQNCFYDPSENSINILPGFITSGIYAEGMDEEELLGGIGFVIGHEISHAFDYAGSQFNAYGQAESVYTSDDEQEFVDKRQKLVDYLDTIETAPGEYVNGTDKSTEATADLCGLQVILERAKAYEGFEYERLFDMMADVFAESYPRYIEDILYVDSHPLSNLRINVSAQMYDEFYDTYGVVEGDGMYLAPEKRITIWGEDAG